MVLRCSCKRALNNSEVRHCLHSFSPIIKEPNCRENEFYRYLLEINDLRLDESSQSCPTATQCVPSVCAMSKESITKHCLLALPTWHGEQQASSMTN